MSSFGLRRLFAISAVGLAINGPLPAAAESESARSDGCDFSGWLYGAVIAVSDDTDYTTLRNSGVVEKSVSDAQALISDANKDGMQLPVDVSAVQTICERLSPEEFDALGGYFLFLLTMLPDDLNAEFQQPPQ